MILWEFRYPFCPQFYPRVRLLKLAAGPARPLELPQLVLVPNPVVIQGNMSPPVQLVPVLQQRLDSGVHVGVGFGGDFALKGLWM